MYVIPNPVLVVQVQRNIRQEFELLTTPAFFLETGPTRNRKLGISRGKQERGRSTSICGAGTIGTENPNSAVGGPKKESKAGISWVPMVTLTIAARTETRKLMS